MSSLRPLALPGAAALIYAVLMAHWKEPQLVLLLVVLLAIVLMFPMRFGKISTTVSFPILYVMALITGYEATAILATLIVLCAHLVQQRPIRNVVLNGLNYLIAMVGAGLAVRMMLLLPVEHDQMYFYMAKLFVALLTFILIINRNLLWYTQRVLRTTSTREMIIKFALLNFIVSFGYCAMFLFLANDPKTSTSGELGLLFFFLPLVAVAIVLHLIINLTRTKTGLEKLFEVSQSINEQIDLRSVLTQVVFEANSLVRGHCGLLFLVQDDHSLKQVVSTSPELDVPRIAAGQGLAGRVAETGNALLVLDCARDARLLPGETEPNSHAMLLVPISIDGKVVGVLSLGKKEPHSLTSDDLKMMRVFATHAAVAMKNAMYVEEREKRLLLEERNRLAREMHDGLAQDLASAILQLEMLRRQAVLDEIKTGLTELQENLRRTTTTVRQSIYSLRPEPYKNIGLVPALRAHLEEVEAQHGLRTRLDLNRGTAHQVSPCTARTVFQIVSEAIQNAVKHAQASELVVTLNVDADMLVLSVRDNGRGFHFGQMILQAAERKSFGIENLYSLADQVGGSLDINTAPGKGTEVILEIPRSEKEEETAHDDSRVAL
ncbi:MAG: GAF domain-containing sensor histidine kinase [Tumebacillaceae bacterium]